MSKSKTYMVDAEENVLYMAENDADRTGLIDQKLKPRHEVVDTSLTKKKGRFTLMLCISFVGLGLNIALLGPTLLSIKDSINANGIKISDTMISYVFTVRGLGYLVGSFIGGMCFDAFNSQLLLTLITFGVAIFTALVPFSKTQWMLAGSILVWGGSMGALDTGGNVVCVNLWGKKSAPFMQALHFSFGVGAFIAPLVAEPFIDSPQYDEHNSNYNCHRTNCSYSPCHNGGICKDGPNLTYTCSCVPGYNGIDCETDISECNSNPCVYGDCNEDEIDHFICNCTAGFNGTLCDKEIDECLSDPCVNDGECEDDINSYSCVCLPGYTGENCEIEIIECETHHCENYQVCIDGINTYSCECPAGYTGNNCTENIDECLGNPCDYHHACIDTIGSFNCMCAAGYTGKNCKTDIDECASDPCKNSGTCNNLSNQYICYCIDGFNGINCEENINECETHHCEDFQVCIDGINASFCECPAGYTGINCTEIINECDSIPCSHNGICNDFINFYNCTCTSGYTGIICDEDIDECKSNPCNHNGTCKDEIDKYTCQCAAGFNGQNCEIDIDDCKNISCSEERPLCIDGINQYFCNCSLGYEGENCTIEIDECSSNPCSEEHQACVDLINEYSCNCIPGFTGEKCKTDIDECASKPCANNGTCHDKFNHYTCKCAEGFFGINCDDKEPVNRRKKRDASTTYAPVINSNSGTSSKPSSFQTAYLIVACIMFVVSAVFFCVYFNGSSNGVKNTETNNSSTVSQVMGITDTNSDPVFQLQMIAALFFFFFLYVGMEVAYGGQIFRYATMNCFDKDDAIMLNSLFWGSFALARLFSICVTQYISAQTMLGIDMLGCLISSIALTAAYDNPTVVWIGTAILGLSMSSIWPAGISWAEGYLKITGRVTSIFVVGSSFGEMAIPWVVGSAMSNLHPKSLMICMLVISVLCLILFFLMRMLASRQGERYTVRTAGPEELLDIVQEIVEIDHSTSNQKKSGSNAPKRLKQSFLKQSSKKD